jgi:hypothetical protein
MGLKAGLPRIGLGGFDVVALKQSEISARLYHRVALGLVVGAASANLLHL